MASKDKDLFPNVDSSFTKKKYSTILFSLLDNGKAKLVFFKEEKSEDILLAGSITGKLNLRMYDGKKFINLQTTMIVNENSVLEFVITDEQLNHVGLIDGELKIYNDNNQFLGSLKFAFEIDKEIVEQYFIGEYSIYKLNLNDLKVELDEKDKQEFPETGNEEEKREFEPNSWLASVEVKMDSKLGKLKGIENGTSSLLVGSTVIITDYEQHKIGNDWSPVFAYIQTNILEKGIIVVPDGEYCWKNVSLKSDITILLNENVFVTPPAGTITKDHFFRVTGTESDNTKNIKVKHGNFDGQGIINQVVQILFGENISVIRINAKNMYGTVVYAKDSYLVNVIQCKGDTMDYGVIFEATEKGFISDGKYSNLRRDGVLIYNGSKNCEVSGTTIDTYTIGGETGRAGIHAYGSSKVIIKKNIVLNGLFDSEGIRFRDTNNFSCVGNWVDGAGNGGVAVVRIGDFKGLEGGHGFIIRNFICNVRLRGISVQYPESDPVTIYGNTIRGITSSNPIDAAVGIMVKNKGSFITANNIFNSEGEGIVISGNNNHVTSNNIQNIGGGKIGSRAGIYILGGTNIICKDNVVLDEFKKMVNGIRLSTTATAIIKDNIVTGGINGTLRLDGKLIGNNSGRIIMPANTTSITVMHGLIYAPTKVILTPQSSELGLIWVSSITDVSFKINCTNTPTGGRSVGWIAEI